MGRTVNGGGRRVYGGPGSGGKPWRVGAAGAWYLRERGRQRRGGGGAPTAPSIWKLEQDGETVLVWYNQGFDASIVSIRVYRDDIGLVAVDNAPTDPGYSTGGIVDVGGTYAWQITGVNAQGVESAPSLWVGMMV